MNLEHVRTLARYNRWMNGKLYALAAELSDEERKRDRGAFFKSIHGTLDHIVIGDRVWLARFTGDEALTTGIQGFTGLYSDFAELRGGREATDALIDRWAADLTDGILASTLRYVRRGETFENPMWWLALHFFNHQTHHRGQVTTLLMQAGRDPGVTDLIAMLREEAAHSAVQLSSKH